MSRLHTDYLGAEGCSRCGGDGWYPTPKGLTRCECLLSALELYRRCAAAAEAEAITAEEAARLAARRAEEARIDALVLYRLAVERGRPRRPTVTETELEAAARTAEANTLELEAERRRRALAVELGPDTDLIRTVDVDPELL